MNGDNRYTRATLGERIVTGIDCLRACAAGVSPVPHMYLLNLTRLVAVFCLLLVCSVPDVRAAAFDPGTLSFALKIDGRLSSYRTYFSTALPGERMRLQAASGAGMNELVVETPAGVALSRDRRGWWVQAPAKPGIYPVHIRRPSRAEDMLVRLFVLTPANQMRNGVLNGYRIGQYPAPLKKLAIYYAPKGYIEVTADNVDTPISPHFRLGQFVCKQAAGYPKYMVLRPRLLLKLEGLLADANAAGWRIDTFHVMSGYRTPYYNHLIGNVKNSRHMWGGAADIFIDQPPENNRMDDLNHDGRINKADAMVLYRLASTYVQRHRRKDLIGGVGAYGATAAHGPFVHVDVRGIGARWGYETE